MPRLHLAPLLLAAAVPGLAAAQDPFSPSQRWLVEPATTAWCPEQVAFAGDESFVWCSVRGADQSLLLVDTVSTGAGQVRAVVPPLAQQFRAPEIAAGRRADRVFALRQVSTPSIYRRTPLVSAFDPLTGAGGSVLDEAWTHDMGIRINGPVELATDRLGERVVAAAWNDVSAEVRLHVLDGTDGALLGAVDLPAYGLNALTVSEDGARIVVSAGMTLYVLDGSANLLHTRPLALATRALGASADGRTLAYGDFSSVRLLREVPGRGLLDAGAVQGGATEIPSELDLSADGTLAAIGWWDYSTGRSARLEVFDLLFQFPMASHDLPGLPGATQNLVTAARFSDDGRRAAFSTWGNGADPEVFLLELGAFAPVLVVDTPGSVRGMALDSTGTRFALAAKSVHASTSSARGDVRLVDSGERPLQLLETPRLGGVLKAAARRPGAPIGWFMLGTPASQPATFPGVEGALLLQRDRIQFRVGFPDADGRMDLDLPLPGSGALRGTQLHLQAAFRSGASIALTPDLVSPFLLD